MSAGLEKIDTFPRLPGPGIGASRHYGLVAFQEVAAKASGIKTKDIFGSGYFCALALWSSSDYSQSTLTDIAGIGLTVVL